MRKKCFKLLVLLFSIVVFSSKLVVAPQSVVSCCTFEISADYCLTGGFGDGTYPDVNDCCGVDDSCRANNFFNQDCDDVDGSGQALCGDAESLDTQGCCTDTCNSGNFNECPSNHKDSPCSVVTECAKGCCRCFEKDSSGTLQAVSVENLKTESYCASTQGCLKVLNDNFYGYEFDLDTDNCFVGYSVPVTFALSGEVTDAETGQGIPGADVVLIGVGATLTDLSGVYRIQDIPEGEYNLRIGKSRYRAMFDVINIDSSNIPGDFSLSKLDQGEIHGTVFNADNNAPLAGAKVTVDGFASHVFTHNDGSFNFTLPFGLDYIIRVVKDGFKDGVVLDVDLGGVVSIARPVISLESLREATAKFVESNGRQGIEIFLQGGTCNTDTNGECPIPHLEVGSYDWRAYNSPRSKSIFTEDSGTLQITSSNVGLVSVGREVVVPFNIRLRSDLCNITGELVRQGVCANSHKPQFCEIGDTSDHLNDVIIENYCAGGDGVVGKRCANDKNRPCSDNSDCGAGVNCIIDDCPCELGFGCNVISGRCMPEDKFCEPSCTYRGSNVCQKECEGTNGCSFYSPESMNACHGQTIGVLQNSNILSGLGGDTVVCCSGPIFNSGEENCNTTDFDEDLDGQPQCIDVDCLGEQCKEGSPEYVCRGVSGDAKCSTRSCPNGVIDATMSGCLCGNLSIVNEGEFCCPLTGAKFLNEASFSNSVCGDTACSSARPEPGVCCEGSGCKNDVFEIISSGVTDPCRPNDGNRPIKDGSEIPLICCPENSCLDTPEFLCDHESQCVETYDYADLLNIGYDTTKFPCKQPCIEFEECLGNVKINVPLNWRKPACKCGDALAVFVKGGGPAPDKNGKFCCLDGNNYSESDSPCPNAAPTGILYGSIKDSRSVPVPFALIRTDTGAQTVADGTGSYNFSVNVGQRQISVSKQSNNPIYRITRGSATIGEGISTPKNFILQQIPNPCDDMNPPEQAVGEDNFTVSYTEGQPRKVILNWISPDCTNIEYFSLRNNRDDRVITISNDKRSYSEEVPLISAGYDTDVIYFIAVHYDKGRVSREAQAIYHIGSEECEGREEKSEFCGSLVQRYKCGEKNVAQLIQDCDCEQLDFPSGNPPDPDAVQEYFSCTVCAGPDERTGKTKCRNPNVCGAIRQGAYPFGLYYKESNCLGQPASPNYCYYDYYISEKQPPFSVLNPLLTENQPFFNPTNSLDPFSVYFSNPTTTDKCLSCSGSMTCHNYKSPSACRRNHCDVGNCKWKDTPFSETGAGICYEEDYEGSDRCGVCGSDSELFINTLCTQDVCSVLGKCFSKEANSYLVSQTNNDGPTSSVTNLALPLITGNAVAVTHTISINNFQFSPSDITINLGDTIRWVNNHQGVPHTVSFNSLVDASTGRGVDSGTLSPASAGSSGGIFEFTFTDVGTFNYHCNFHPSMAGSVTVNAPPASTPVASSTTPSPGLVIPPVVLPVGQSSSSSSSTSSNTFNPFSAFASSSTDQARLDPGIGCRSCEEATCVEYNSQLLCEGGQSASIVNGDMVTSNDVCGIGVCKWTGDRCVKDGNGNSLIDCEEEINIESNSGFVDASSRRCRRDIFAPETVLVSDWDFELGASGQPIDFAVTDAFSQFAHTWGMTFNYCIDKTNSCDPSDVLYYENSTITLFDDGTTGVLRDFIKFRHDGEPGTYYLRYYTLDKHFNRESVKSLLFYADIKPPALVVDINVKLGDPDPDGDGVLSSVSSDILITLATDEESFCEDRLYKATSSGLVDQGITTIRRNVPLISGTNLNYSRVDGLYYYVVGCVDAFLNVVTVRERVRIDANGNVKIISPPELPGPGSVLNVNNATFELTTLVPSNCDLLSPGGTIEMVSLNGLRHTATDVEIEYRSEYHTDYEVRCEDKSFPEIVDTEPDFEFAVDLTPPNVTLRMQDDLFTVNKQGTNWQSTFGGDVSVSIDCNDPLIDEDVEGSHFGPELPDDFSASALFGCLEINVSRTCDPILDKNFSRSVTILNDTTICYSCEDRGDNMANVSCGRVYVDKEGPRFNMEFFEKDTGVEVVKLEGKSNLRREVPSRQYTVKVTVLNEQEKLRNPPTMFFEINGHKHDADVFTKDVGNFIYEGTFAIPYTQEFDGLDSDDEVVFIVTGTDKFGNFGNLSSIVVLDTTVPKAPILNDFGNTVYVKYVDQDDVVNDTFRQTGLEADTVSFRNIIFEHGVRPSEIGAHNVTGRTLVQFTDQNRMFSGMDFTELDSVLTSEDPNLTLRLLPEVVQMNQNGRFTLKGVPDDFSLANYGRYIRFLGPGTELPTREFYIIDTIVRPQVNKISLPSQFSSSSITPSTSRFKTFTALDDDGETSVFASLGLGFIKGKELRGGFSEYVSLPVELYQQPVPKSWFDQRDISLKEGSNWFFAYAVDEAGNVGEKTQTKKVVLDNKGPKLKVGYPFSRGEFSAPAGTTVSLILTDINSGIDKSQINITVDGGSYSCNPLRCKGTKNVEVLLRDLSLGPGLHMVNVNVKDFTGNSLDDTWEFRINPDAPPRFVASTFNGRCISYDQCYFNLTKPSVLLSYPIGVEVTQVKLSTGEVADISNEGNNRFRINTKTDLGHGDYYFEITANLPGMASYVNFLPFSVDNIKPEIYVDSVTRTSLRDVNISGVYDEINLDKITITGDVVTDQELSFLNLPMDYVFDNVFLFARNVSLDVNGSGVGVVYVTAFDKAGNYHSVNLTIYYDVTPPQISNVVVNTTNITKKLFVTNISYYKTNDDILRITGRVDKELSKLVLRTGTITKHANEIRNDLKTFKVDVNLFSSITPGDIENVVLEATDTVGNTAYYFMTLELDRYKPVVDIKWI